MRVQASLAPVEVLRDVAMAAVARLPGANVTAVTPGPIRAAMGSSAVAAVKLVFSK